MDIKISFFHGFLLRKMLSTFSSKKYHICLYIYLKFIVVQDFDGQDQLVSIGICLVFVCLCRVREFSRNQIFLFFSAIFVFCCTVLIVPITKFIKILTNVKIAKKFELCEELFFSDSSASFLLLYNHLEENLLIFVLYRFVYGSKSIGARPFWI